GRDRAGEPGTLEPTTPPPGDRKGSTVRRFAIVISCTLIDMRYANRRVNRIAKIFPESPGTMIPGISGSKRGLSDEVARGMSCGGGVGGRGRGPAAEAREAEVRDAEGPRPERDRQVLHGPRDRARHGLLEGQRRLAGAARAGEGGRTREAPQGAGA